MKNMNYEEARAYLNQISKTGSVLGLDTIRALMEELGNPERNYRVIHIAGTNGKGSILTYTANILKEAGYMVGTYTSPAVMGYEERFQVDCEWMTPDELPSLVEKVREAAESIILKGHTMPTVFEFETAIALLYFAERGCEFAILETGLGGDLDSTNVVEFTELCAFASISMDHTDVLGSTLSEIAMHKSGIIKPGSVVIEGWQGAEVAGVIRDRAEELSADVIWMDRESLKVNGRQSLDHSLLGDGEALSFDYKWHKDMRINMLGRHQFENAAVAIEIADALAVSEDAIRSGLAASRWSGRFELVGGEPPVILDGAHNPDAARRLAEGLDDFSRSRPIYAVLGMFKDKAYEEIADIIAPKLAGGYAIDLPDSSRSLAKETLADTFVSRGVDVAEAYSLEEAIEEASEDARRNGGIVLITGSLSYLGEAKRIIEGTR